MDLIDIVWVWAEVEVISRVISRTLSSGLSQLSLDNKMCIQIVNKTLELLRVKGDGGRSTLKGIEVARKVG